MGIQTQKRMLRRSRRNTRRSRASVRPLFPNIMVPVAEVVPAVPVEKRRRKRHTTNCEENAGNDGADIILLICTKGCCRFCRHWCHHHGCCSSHFCQRCRSVPGCCCCRRRCCCRRCCCCSCCRCCLRCSVTKRVCPTSHQMQKARFPHLRTYRVTAKTEGAILGRSIQTRECSPSVAEK